MPGRRTRACSRLTPYARAFPPPDCSNALSHAVRLGGAVGRYEPPNTLCLDRRIPRRSGADNSEPNCTHGACSQPNDCEAIGEPACRAGELKVQSSPSKCREHRVDAICICPCESGGGLRYVSLGLFKMFPIKLSTRMSSPRHTWGPSFGPAAQGRTARSSRTGTARTW